MILIDKTIDYTMMNRKKYSRNDTAFLKQIKTVLEF